MEFQTIFAFLAEKRLNPSWISQVHFITQSTGNNSALMTFTRHHAKTSLPTPHPFFFFLSACSLFSILFSQLHFHLSLYIFLISHFLILSYFYFIQYIYVCMHVYFIYYLLFIHIYNIFTYIYIFYIY